MAGGVARELEHVIILSINKITDFTQANKMERMGCSGC